MTTRRMQRAAIDPSFQSITGFLLAECADFDHAIVEEVLEKFSINWPELRVAVFLLGGSGDKGVSQQQIADACRLNKATVVQVIDSLAKRGMLQRRDHPEDRRINIVVLTTRGREISRKILREVIEAEQSRVFDRLSERELETLTSLLRKIIEGNNQHKKK